LQPVGYARPEPGASLSDHSTNTEKARHHTARRWLAAAFVVVAAGLGAAYYASGKGADRALVKALTGGNPDKAPPLLLRYGCGGCHTIPALTGADGKVAPSLEHLRKRVYIAGKLENTPENLIRWIVAPQELAPGSAMPDTGISASEARDVAAFLYSE
jgi:cytochrome c